MTSAGNNFNYFPEKQLIKVSAVTGSLLRLQCCQGFETTIREIYSP